MLSCHVLCLPHGDGVHLTDRQEASSRPVRQNHFDPVPIFNVGIIWFQPVIESAIEYLNSECHIRKIELVCTLSCNALMSCSESVTVILFFLASEPTLSSARTVNMSLVGHIIRPKTCEKNIPAKFRVCQWRVIIVLGIRYHILVSTANLLVATTYSWFFSRYTRKLYQSSSYPDSNALTAHEIKKWRSIRRTL